MLTSTSLEHTAHHTPGRPPLRLALYHGLPAGGAKRVAFEQARRLSERHSLGLFAVGEADPSFFDLRPYAAIDRAWGFRPSPVFSSPFGRLNPAVRIADLVRLRVAARRVAAEIDAGH